jgi:hypothetical protein
MLENKDPNGQVKPQKDSNWWARPEFESLWPLIPGALVTLIGLFFLLLGKDVNGVIVCYVGVLAAIVGAGKIWMQYVPKQTDIDPADHAQMENAILVVCCFFGMIITGLAIVCGATVTVFKGGTTTGLLWGLGSLFSGGFIGFLFGIPNETESKDSTLHINTSLNQIADWLTKIIVGVSLVNADTAYTYFVKAAAALGDGLVRSADPQQQAAGKAFAAGLIVTFLFLGFTGTYLLARVWISMAIVRADHLALKLSKGP